VDLINMVDLLSKVNKGEAAAAFNFIGLDDFKGIVCAAERQRVPVILQVSQSTAAHLGLDYASALARVAASKASIPMCLHLDHATSIDLVAEAISCGFTSVMYDGSSLPFEENLNITARVVKMAHAAGVSVEAELGRVGGKEDDIDVSADDQVLVDPLQARDFVLATGIDVLAPAVGTVHGLYKGTPNIRFDLIAAVDELVEVPLVLHGGSDVPEVLLRRAIQAGIRKINVGTDLQVAYASALRRMLLSETGTPNMRRVHAAAMDAVCDVACEKIRICEGRC
jgi:ketose-bisphosphate aldolase